MIKFAIVGPECSGKSTLCEALAVHYGCVRVKEFARAHLEEHGPDYVEQDLLNFAMGQVLAEGEAQKLAKEVGAELIICDTDMITIRIWSEEVFGRSHALLKQLSTDVQYDHWLLCRPNIPWEPDPFRENPLDRDRLFAVYEAMLKKVKKPYTIIEGNREQRIAAAVKAIDYLGSE
jgi:nicotinamide riboside kinase